MALGVVSLPQMHWALRLGHMTTFLALAALGGFMLLRKHPFLAGLCFSFLVLKPQYAPIPAMYLLWTRNGRALAGMATGALVFTFVGFAAVGFGEEVVGAVASEPQARATAEPPATRASRLRKARRDRLPPSNLSVFSTVSSSGKRQNHSRI